MKLIFNRWWGSWEDVDIVEIYDCEDGIFIYYFQHHPAWCRSREEKVKAPEYVEQALERMNVPPILRKWWKEHLRESEVGHA